MPTFHYSYSSSPKGAEDLLPPNCYPLRVLEASEQESSKGSPMIKLKLATIPHDRYVWDYLVFSERSLWAIEDFCRSAGLQLPREESDVNLDPRDCAGRICYAELIHETGRDGKTRLKRERYVTRQETLKLNPALLKVELPSDAPRPKKLQQAATGSRAPEPIGSRKDDSDVEPDDIPFAATIYRDVRQSRLNRRVM